MPALTVVMDACVLHLGATPVFVDVDEDTHLISIQVIKDAISPKTKAIITAFWEGLLHISNHGNQKRANELIV